MDELHKLITLALHEDVGRGDITTEAIYSGSELAKAEFVAKEDGIIAGIQVAKHVFSEVDESIRFDPVVKDGARVQRGDIIATVSGPAGSLLTAERTVLNFMQRMSGIATKSRLFADAISHTKAKVLDTRKTIPGHRFTDKWAVKLGGGENHRIGLYDRYLIKENHISVAGSIQAAIENCVAHRKSNKLSAQIEIEVTSLEELRTALEFSDVDYIMLDNMSVELMKEAVSITAGRCKLEASGNVNLETIAAIAETGVDFISVGALTHSVKALDISLLFR
ncbi:MAG: carboxylating nicotinate-nucleotide diphosphorylase [Balneolales bacterium]|nr:carboxylating nicotinate-nucleotide diphosphorylase [Balneolales bacterium]